jgi:polyhydroxyalkanoic acid synthase PhaR subunit
MQPGVKSHPAEYPHIERSSKMADDTTRDAKLFDPMEPWRGMRDIYMDAWGKTMVDMVNSEAYAQASGAMLDSYLTISAPFREAIEKAMLKTLEQLAMPSRADVVSIAERMTNIEMRLDDLDSKLDNIQRLIVQAGAAPRVQLGKALQSTKKRTTKTKPVKRGTK